MIVIIGAGPAGLAASAALGGVEHVLIEQADAHGGLCRSFTLSGCTLDLGGHAFFTRDAAIAELVERSAGGLYAQPRSAWVHSHGTMIPYPFQANLHGLPIGVVRDCLVGLIEAREMPDPSSLARWIEQFGSGICEAFLRPYNEKVWAFPLDRITPEWAGDRIVRPDVNQIVEGALARRDFADFPNAQVRYPARGGYQSILDGLAADATPARLNTRVIGIDPGERQVLLEDGRAIAYSALISTAPLNWLAGLLGEVDGRLRILAPRLDSNSLHLVSFAVAAAVRRSEQRIYAAAPDIPFHKLVLNGNSSDRLRREPLVSIQAEVSFSAWKPVAVDGLVDRVWRSISAMGLVLPGDRVVASDLRTLDLAYPVSTPESIAARDEIADRLRRLGIFAAGRFGAWQYVNADGAIRSGIDAAALAAAFDPLTVA